MALSRSSRGAGLGTALRHARLRPRAIVRGRCAGRSDSTASTRAMRPSHVIAIPRRQLSAADRPGRVQRRDEALASSALARSSPAPRSREHKCDRPGAEGRTIAPECDERGLPRATSLTTSSATEPDDPGNDYARRLRVPPDDALRADHLLGGLHRIRGERRRTRQRSSEGLPCVRHPQPGAPA